MVQPLDVEHQVERGLKSSLISITFNIFLAVCKCLAGFVGHSFAVGADGIESFADVFSSSAAYLGLRVAIKPPDKEHPYGQGKAEPIAGVVVGIALAVAGIAIAFESISRIRTPHSLPRPYTLGVKGSGHSRPTEHAPGRAGQDHIGGLDSLFHDDQ